jgi:undecaprenyl pyrophosphate phosphatase UppP
MKQIIQMIRNRIDEPSPMDILVAFIVTLTIGTFSGEIISRPVNSYIQAGSMLVTLALIFITMRMSILWLIKKVNNK